MRSLLLIISTLFFQFLANAECDKLNEDLSKHGFAKGPETSRDEKDISETRAKVAAAAKRLIKAMREHGITKTCPNLSLHSGPKTTSLTCGDIERIKEKMASRRIEIREELKQLESVKHITEFSQKISSLKEEDQSLSDKSLNLIPRDLDNAHEEFKEIFNDYNNWRFAKHPFGLTSGKTYSLKDLDSLIADIEHLPTKIVTLRNSSILKNRTSLTKSSERLRYEWSELGAASLDIQNLRAIDEKLKDETLKRSQIKNLTKIKLAIKKKLAKYEGTDIDARLKATEQALKVSDNLVHEQNSQEARNMKLFIEGGRVVSYAYYSYSPLGNEDKEVQCDQEDAKPQQSLPPVVGSEAQAR